MTITFNNEAIQKFIQAEIDSSNHLANRTSNRRAGWKAHLDRFHADNYLFIRPSGNPLGNAGFAGKMLLFDLTNMREKLVAIQSIRFIAHGKIAIVIYTIDQWFQYKGQPNEDRAVLTGVFEFKGGVIQRIHTHRCTGQPIPEDEAEGTREPQT